MENKIRSTLNEIYFGKTRDIVNDLRYVISTFRINAVWFMGEITYNFYILCKLQYTCCTRQTVSEIYLLKEYIQVFVINCSLLWMGKINIS